MRDISVPAAAAASDTRRQHKLQTVGLDPSGSQSIRRFTPVMPVMNTSVWQASSTAAEASGWEMSLCIVQSCKGVMHVQAAAGACGVVLLTDADSFSAGRLATPPMHAAVAAAVRGVMLPILVLVADAPAGSPVGSGDMQNGPPDREAADRAAAETLVQHLNSSADGSADGTGDGSMPAINVMGIAGQAGPSEAALIQGLAWLAEHAPPQPCLWVSIARCHRPDPGQGLSASFSHPWRSAANLFLQHC
jgi:hypothetical protein